MFNKTLKNVKLLASHIAIWHITDESTHL